MTASNIRKGMMVLDHRGTVHGTVGEVEGEQLCVMRRGVTGEEGHWMAAAAVEWVDHAVHLFQGANDVGVGAISGSGTGTKEAPRHPAEFDSGKRRRIPLPWLVAALAVALIGVIATVTLRGDDGTSRNVASVAVPGGRSVDIAPGSIGDDLQRFLASPERPPRTFTLRKVEFAEGDVTLPPAAIAEVRALGRVLAVYPKARVAMIAYADVPHNVGVAVDVQTAADLSRRRADALVAALVAAGASAKAVEGVSGNDPAYLDRLAPAAAKDAADRHPDLTVTRK